VNAVPRDSSARLLSAVAAISGLYDIALAAALLLGRSWLVRLFDLAPPVPPVHADLNGLFALAIGLGYILPWRRPHVWRAYLWLMGPFLKGLGALLFVFDHVLRGSPDSFLLFAASDGTLAVVTLVALLATRPRNGHVGRSDVTRDEVQP
jgi:hypothetical protein